METTLASSSEKQVWINQYLTEYVRASGFMPYMGKSANSIFQIKSELQDQAGKTINIPLLTRLKSSGVTGTQVLDGNEEDLGNFNAQVQIDWLRNGVRVPKSTSYLTEIDLLDAAKPMLKTWSAEKLRDSIIDALGSIVIPGAAGVNDTVVSYASATAAQKNAFGAANQDRVLFGAATSNFSATWATALANVDSSADKLSTVIAGLAKRMARLAGNTTPFGTALSNMHIRPFQTEGGREFYVMFCNPYAFRDLKADSVMTAANRDARARNVDDNPLFQDGDLIYEGIIFREIPELTQLTITGAGASSIDVAQNFLCGQQAVAIAYGQQPTPRTDNVKDYGFRPGVAIEELRGQRKLSFGGSQLGVVTVLTSGVAD